MKKVFLLVSGRYAFIANGHLLLNNEKMSKNTGNFLTLYESIERFSADGMRLSLADAGDDVQDANFVFDMADAGILRLYNFLKWVEEMVTIRDGNGFRSPDGGINRDQLRNTLFKEALKTGFFEYLTARDNYKLLCNRKESEMRADLVFRFIETQALLLSPVALICVNVYGRSLERFIVNAKWPETEAVNQILLKQSEFLQRSIREFRLRREATLNPKKKGPQKPKPSAGVKLAAVVYIAERYPEWKVNVLRIVKDSYDANGKKFPDNRAIAQQLSKFGKDAMPFVQAVREKFEEENSSEFVVLETSEFNQREVFENVLEYVVSTLQLASVQFVNTTEPNVPAEVLKNCSPGTPSIQFTFIEEN
uniref:Methionyl/Leucyl tRNA synthetase domain-containing protein n=1 Tax=Ditylenchus dipsaci TaxID=166011 RepID=A0A915DUH3_9BILA